ncbi:MAG: hypothetical protein AAF151_14625 [Cyanobacteria bacterium J06656_5]
MQLLTFSGVGLYAGLKIAKHIYKRCLDIRFFAYALAALMGLHIGTGFYMIITDVVEYRGAIASALNGAGFFMFLGLAAVHVLLPTPPTESQVLRKIARRKVNEAMIDGSQDDDRLLVWNAILEGSHDEI